jgi:hypothetical protein
MLQSAHTDAKRVQSPQSVGATQLIAFVHPWHVTKSVQPTQVTATEQSAQTETKRVQSPQSVGALQLTACVHPWHVTKSVQPRHVTVLVQPMQVTLRVQPMQLTALVHGAHSVTNCVHFSQNVGRGPQLNAPGQGPGNSVSPLHGMSRGTTSITKSRTRNGMATPLGSLTTKAS